MNIELVILAAGIGSRFKGGIKQLTKINDKTLMELSIDNAKKAGIKKVNFIIRKELEQDFNELIVKNIDIDYSFIYQDINNLPISVKVNRIKPWGTGHALLSLKDKVNNPFIIINADDYYEEEVFEKLVNHLKNSDDYTMIGYKLKNTIFTDAGENRGICYIKDNYLLNIKETYKIKKINNEYINETENFDPNTIVSMNIWGFNKSIFTYFEEEFIKFLKSDNLEEKEFLIPTVINTIIKNNNNRVKVIETNKCCIGITFKEDVEKLREIL